MVEAHWWRREWRRRGVSGTPQVLQAETFPTGAMQKGMVTEKKKKL
jgi:hypothetical protein